MLNMKGSDVRNALLRDAPGVEKPAKNEEEDIKNVAGQFCRFQMNNFAEHLHCYRGTHLKTQGVGLYCYRTRNIRNRLMASPAVCQG